MKQDIKNIKNNYMWPLCVFTLLPKFHFVFLFCREYALFINNIIKL